MKNKLNKFILHGIMAGIMCSCSTTTSPNAFFQTRKTKVTKMRARITYYSNATDSKWGSRIASSNKRAVEGVTLAAHPAFKFGTQIRIPNLKGVAVKSEPLLVQDRGTAVTNRKASHHKEPVFDVFVYARTRREGLRREKYLASINPDIMEVEVLEPVPVPVQFQKYQISRN